MKQKDNVEIELNNILAGIDKDDIESDVGWWETSTGVEFGTKKLQEIKDFVIQQIAIAERQGYERGYSDGVRAVSVQTTSDSATINMPTECKVGTSYEILVDTKKERKALLEGIREEIKALKKENYKNEEDVLQSFDNYNYGLEQTVKIVENHLTSAE